MMLSAERKAEILKSLSEALERDRDVALIVIEDNAVTLDTSMTEDHFLDLLEEMIERSDDLSEDSFAEAAPEFLN